MKPVKPLDANMVYKGPTPEIGDLECTRVRPGVVRSQWRLSDGELGFLAAGADVELVIYSEPIPPVALNVVDPFCPECMVVMEFRMREPEKHPCWRFACPNCERWA